MNTRILRMCERSGIKGHISLFVRSLGQLQPVLFSHEGGKRFTFRAEDVAQRNGEMQSCISVLDFRYHKPLIRRLFSELEGYRATGAETPAARWWREYQERQAHAKATKPVVAKPLIAVELDLFGDPIPTKSSNRQQRSARA